MKALVKNKTAVILTALALILSAAVLSPLTLKAKAAGEGADVIQTAFTGKAADDWSLNEFAQNTSGGVSLIAGGKISTVSAMNSFLMQIHLGSVEKGFEIFFGDNGGEKFVISFNGAYINLTNLLSADSELNYVPMTNRISSDSMVQLEVMSGTVTIGIKKADQPYEQLSHPDSTFKLKFAGVSQHSGKIGFSAGDGSTVTIQRVNIYSLSGSIHIPTENYVAPVVPEPEKDNLKVILLATLIPAGVVLLCGGGVALYFLVFKKKKNTVTEESDNAKG